MTPKPYDPSDLIYPSIGAVDEQLVGSAIPNDAEFLATVQFSKAIEAARGPMAVATTYVDNVYFEAPTFTLDSRSDQIESNRRNRQYSLMSMKQDYLKSAK